MDPGLEAHELPNRRLYASPDFVRWLDAELPELEGDTVDADLSPIEQVFALFHKYVVGESFGSDRRFKKLSGTPNHHVWELKTDDVRVFGWVPKKDVYICCYGDLKLSIETLKKYGRYIAQTKFFRDHLDLDEPKAIEGERYQDVISN